jgi:cytochrome c
MRSLIWMTVSALAAQTGPAVGPGSPAGDSQRGKKLYVSYGCYECHGYEGQGGRAGARIAPGPIAFPAFSKYVRQPSRQMPPYTIKVATDQDLSDIYAFLRTIPRPPSAKSISILND